MSASSAQELWGDRKVSLLAKARRLSEPDLHEEPSPNPDQRPTADELSYRRWDAGWDWGGSHGGRVRTIDGLLLE